MTTHARLRQVADKMLAAYSDVEFYLSPGTVVDDIDFKQVEVIREYDTAKRELEETLAVAV